MARLVRVSYEDLRTQRVYFCLFFKFENRRRDVISLNQSRGMSAKMTANGIRTHARTNQRRINIHIC